jgi:hypothetical protein
MKLQTVTLFLIAALNGAFANAATSAEASAESVGSRLVLRNPLIRVCVINGGTFEVHPVGADEIAFCRWNRAVVDSQTLLSNLDGVQSEAAGLLMSGTVATTCADVGAASLILNSTSNRQEICDFNDESKLSLETIQADSTNPDRMRLKDVLLGR